MTALLIVDVQNDFIPGGALPVKEGDQVIAIIDELLKKPFDAIVATKDWHPEDHGSFAENHGKKKGEKISLFGLEQMLWPVHCVQNTYGAEFAQGWDTSKINRVFYKGTDKTIDSYSTFFDNGHRKSTGLGDYLREKNIKKIYISGIATDYCVKYSVLDALKLGFEIYVVTDACRGVNLQKNDSTLALNEMKNAGAYLIHSKDLKIT